MSGLDSSSFMVLFVLSLFLQKTPQNGGTSHANSFTLSPMQLGYTLIAGEPTNKISTWYDTPVSLNSFLYVVQKKYLLLLFILELTKN